MIAYILPQEDTVIIKQWKTSSTFYDNSLFKADKQCKWYCSISMLLNVFSTDSSITTTVACKYWGEKRRLCRLYANCVHVHP